MVSKNAEPAIRPAATLILLRSDGAILMGQRTTGAVFLPGAYVFPGGAIEPADDATGLDPATQNRLKARSTLCPERVVGAALRELQEETGLAAKPGAAGAIRYVMRAITPPGRPRRFDAYILAAKAADVVDTQTLPAGDGELTGIHWVRPDARADLKLAFPTRMALEEIDALAPGIPQPDRVPFLYRDRDGQNRIDHI
ncbi:MAG: NUDIX hydrolase [Pseudomonadota bacterium]